MIAITGASGFLGQHLVRWFADHARAVREISREELDSPALALALNGADTVVHLAGRAHVMRDPSADPLQAYRAANVELTRKALEAAAEAGCRTFLLASSIKAVGERSITPWTEETLPEPVDPYGVSKLEAERLVAAEGARLGLRTVILRFPLIYGAGMRANMLRLFRTIDRGWPLPVGGIRNRRSLLYAGNAAAAIARALETDRAGLGLYFVSDGRDLSTPELVQAIAEALGRPTRLITVPAGLIHLAGRLGDALAPVMALPLTSSALSRLTGSLQVSTRLLRERLGFVPPFSVEEGLRLTAAWYRAAGGKP